MAQPPDTAPHGSCMGDGPALAWGVVHSGLVITVYHSPTASKMWPVRSAVDWASAVAAPQPLQSAPRARTGISAGWAGSAFAAFVFIWIAAGAGCKPPVGRTARSRGATQAEASIVKRQRSFDTTIEFVGCKGSRTCPQNDNFSLLKSWHVPSLFFLALK